MYFQPFVTNTPLKEDDILIRSRFGDPSVTLSGGDMNQHVLKELVADLKSRIQ